MLRPTSGEWSTRDQAMVCVEKDAISSNMGTRFVRRDFPKRDWSCVVREGIVARSCLNSERLVSELGWLEIEGNAASSVTTTQVRTVFCGRCGRRSDGYDTPKVGQSLFGPMIVGGIKEA